MSPHLFLIPAIPVVLVLLLLLWVRLGEGPQIYQPCPPLSRPGLWFMAHRADRRVSFQHLYFCITPTNPDWAERYPGIFAHKDSEGRAFCTLGAGPAAGKLVLEFNRIQELRDPVSFEEKIAVKSQAEEDAFIIRLLEAPRLYQQQLAFGVWPPMIGEGYNCNSMIAAIVRRSGLKLPKFSRRFMLCPGIRRAVPEKYFEIGAL